MSEETNTEQKQLTPQELAERRENLKKFYKEQISLLKLQEEFERLGRDIEQHKLDRTMAIMRLAHIMNPQPEPEGDPEKKPEEETKKDRVLKKA